MNNIYVNTAIFFSMVALLILSSTSTDAQPDTPTKAKMLTTTYTAFQVVVDSFEPIYPMPEWSLKDAAEAENVWRFAVESKGPDVNKTLHIDADGHMSFLGGLTCEEALPATLAMFEEYARINPRIDQ